MLGFNNSGLKTPILIRQTAKIGLAAAYAAQRTFYAKYGRYTTDLFAIGFYPSSPEMGYKMGFLKPLTFKSEVAAGKNRRENPNRMNLDSFLDEKFENTEDNFYYSESVKDVNLLRYKSFCKTECSANENSFEMLFALAFDEDHVDVWIVNSKNEFVLVQDGFPANDK